MNNHTFFCALAEMVFIYFFFICLFTLLLSFISRITIFFDKISNEQKKNHFMMMCAHNTKIVWNGYKKMCGPERAHHSSCIQVPTDNIKHTKKKNNNRNMISDSQQWKMCGGRGCCYNQRNCLKKQQIAWILPEKNIKNTKLTAAQCGWAYKTWLNSIKNWSKMYSRGAVVSTENTNVCFTSSDLTSTTCALDQSSKNSFYSMLSLLVLRLLLLLDNNGKIIKKNKNSHQLVHASRSSVVCVHLKSNDAWKRQKKESKFRFKNCKPNKWLIVLLFSNGKNPHLS
jgi:hypothetical protein